MSKISELDPILGINTRTEDLFVIVNLIQGDDGTKSITRKELVASIQYEVFDRITITGGSISGVNMFNSTLSGVTINDSIYNRGTMDGTAITNVTIDTATATAVTMDTSTITQSSFNNGTANNVAITGSSFNNGTMNTVAGDNVTLINSTIDDSVISDSTINDSTANNLIVNTGTMSNIIMSNFALSTGTMEAADITASDFSNGTGNNNVFTNTQMDNPVLNNVEIEGGTANNLILQNLVLDEVVMTDVDIRRGIIADLSISNSTFVGALSDVTIINSDFSDGTGNNNVWTNSEFRDGVIRNSVIANTQFQGGLENVEMTAANITSSTADGLTQKRSTFSGGIIQESDINNSDIREGTIEKADIANSEIVDSKLVNFNMDLDEKFDAPIDENSYFALKNVKTGKTESFTYKQLNTEINRTVAKALKVHVAIDGDDNNPGSILAPVKTLKRAAEIAVEKAGGVYDRNDVNNAVHISVGPGTHYVDEPVALPDDCSLTSTSGQYATVIEKLPGYEMTNGILVGSGCYVQGFSYTNFKVDNFDFPEGGFAIAYRPGALLRRSPYIRDSSQLSNFLRADIEPPLNPFNSKGTVFDLGQEFYFEPGHSPQNQFELDDEVTFSSGASGFITYVDDIDSNRQIYIRNLKGNVEPGDILYAQRGGTGTIQSIGIDDFPNRLVGRGGGCLLADRRVLDTDSLYTYVLCFGFTPRTQNGVGYVARAGAGVNGIGSLSIFSREAFYALDGGQVTLNNSGTQFGDISMRAKGSTTIVRPAQADVAQTQLANTAFADLIEANRDEILDDMVAYLTSNTTGIVDASVNNDTGLGYQGYNADKCFRDTGIIVDNVGYDIALNSNYWGRLNGITYRSPISYVVVNEQLTETVGSIEHLKGEIEYLFAQSNTQVNDRVSRSVNETLNILENGEEFANSIIFADTGVESAVAARKMVQDNRDFIINEFTDWIDDNPYFYAYDSAACRRDVKSYILPAVKYDMLLDTNYNSVIAGQAYYFAQAKAVVNNQRNETIAAYERLRKETDEIIQANSAPGAVDSYSAFNEIIDTIADKGQKFTPTKATYDPVTGNMVITLGGGHGITVGRYVTLLPESFTFTCTSDNNATEIVHPRKHEKAHKSALPVTAVTAGTITVNVGASAANFVHTFVSVLDNAVSVLGSEIVFSDDANIPVAKRNARKQLQSNKQFIQDHMENWADQEFYFYDSDKCQRDTSEYILPAVARDVMLGTNYNAIITGAAYRTKSGEVSVTEQLEETVGAFANLKLLTANTITSNSIAVDRSDRAFDEIIGLLNNNGKKYTPSNATYAPETGLTVLTIGSHDFAIGDNIYIEPNSLVFTCALDGNATEHSYPATTFTKHTPTNATYDPLTGEFSATIGSHNLQAGDTVTFAPESIVFTCNLDNNVTNHPAPEAHHPFYNKPVTIDRVTVDTLYMNVGAVGESGGGAHTFVSANADAITSERRHPAYKSPVTITDVTATSITVNVGESSDTSVHTFVSATTNAVREADMWDGRFTALTGTSYDPVSGNMNIEIGQHDLPVGKWIQIDPESIVFSCDVGGVVGNDPAPLPGHPAYNEPVKITGTTATAITVNVGNANGHANTHTFVSATKDCINSNALYFTDSAKFLKAYTPTTSTYDPVTGVMVITIPGHDLTTDDHIELQPLSFEFSCDLGGNDKHPRIGDKAYGLPLEITATTTNTITVNCGNAGSYTGTHTFVAAEEGAVVKVGASEQGTYAARQIQSNKKFIRDEVDAWIKDNYFVYDKDKCQRDSGYILNAVRRDLLTGSNVNSVFMGRGYRIGTAGANEVINNQQTETVGAINFLKSSVSAITSGTAQTRAEAGFDEIIDIIQNNTPDAFDFGVHAISDDHYRARVALQANKAFMQDELTAFLAAAHPTLVYDAADCERDLGLFIDAVSWDVQHGSNAQTRANAGLYFENAVGVLEGDQVVPTAEAYEHISYIAGQIVRGEVVDNLQSVTTQTITAEDTYTPTNATYDPVSGIMEATIGTHTFAVGDRITIDPESITFSCAAFGGGTDSHPNANDPNLRKPFIITAISATTITVNAGSANGYNGAHTFVSADSDCIRAANFAEAYTPTTATYDHIGGSMTLTLGDRHRFVAGDYVIFDENAITFSCPSNGGGNLSHPRPTDPIFNKPVLIDSVTDTTITLQVGEANVDAVHTFVSASVNGVRRSNSVAASNAVVGLFKSVADVVRDDDGTLPAEVEPQYKTNPAGYTSDLVQAYEKIAGITAKLQFEVIEHIRETYNGLAYNDAKCYRDMGYIIDGVSEDIEYGGNDATLWNANYYFEGAISVLPLEQREPTSLAFQHLANTIESVVTNATVTPTTGNTTTQKTTGQAGNATIAAAAKALANIVANIIDDRTPADLPAADTANSPKMDPGRTFARKSLQWNRRFIQEEVIQYVKDDNYVYDEGKCARDLGFIIDAVKRDVQTGGNYNSLYAGKSYRIGTVGADKVIEDQLAETVEAIKYAQADIEAQLTGTAKTRATTAFTNVITTMESGYDQELGYDYNDSGNTGQGQSNLNCEQGMQLNRAFIKAEATAYIANNFPSLSYDINKCERDTGIMIDAVSHDIIHGGNTAMINVARLYFENGLSTLSADQRNPTSTLYGYLGEVAEKIVLKQTVSPSLGNAVSQVTVGFNAADAAEAAATKALWEIVEDIIADDSLANLPDEIEPNPNGAGVGYDEVNAAVIEDRRDTLTSSVVAYLNKRFGFLGYSEERCRRDAGYMVDAISHDIQYGGNSAMYNTAGLYFKNAVNILPVDQREPTRRAFIHLADTVQKVIRNERIKPQTSRRYTPTNAAYDPSTGVFTATLGTGHNLVAGDYIYIEPSSIVFTCALDGNATNHPAPEPHHPYYMAPMLITSATSTTVTTNVGAVPAFSESGGVHTFVSAADNSISKVIGNTEKQHVNHRQARRDIAQQAKDLALIVANTADDRNEDNIPAIQYPMDEWIQHDIIAAKEAIGDAIDTLTIATTNYISNTYNGLGYAKEKCRRDVGALVDALSHDVNYQTNFAMRTSAGLYFENAVSILPFDQRKQTAKFFTHMADVVEAVVQEQAPFGSTFTATNATYDGATGIFTATIGSGHGLEAGDFVQFEPESFTFSCDTGSGPANHASPEAHHPFYNKPCPIIKAEPTVITMQVGSYASPQAHTFVSALADGLKKVIPTDVAQDFSGTAATAVEGEEVADLLRIVEDAIRRDSLDAIPDLVEPNTGWVDASKIWAARAIEDNKDFLADDVTQFLADNFTILDYTKAKCRRDSGYIIDAISYDLNYGGNLASRWNADFYYWNNELRIPESTRVATAQSYRQLGKIISEVVTGDYKGQVTRGETGTAVEAKQAYENGLIFYDILLYNSPKELGELVEPNYAYEENKVFSFAKDILGNNRRKLQFETQRFITSEYKFIDLPKTYRDGGNLLDVLQNDLKFIDFSKNISGAYNAVGSGGDKSTRAFAAALFNIDSQHVFPVFNPPAAFSDWRKLRFKGTVENGSARDAITSPKRWDAYIIPINNNTNRYVGEIWYWNGTTWLSAGSNNTDLLYSFYTAWERMRDYINTQLAPDAAHINMITQLIDAVLVETVLRPNFLAFGSLVESIAHQFNGASAGVNRNALPLNFRNVGAAISATASVLSEDGGRIRWSGSDELNNQYFARGLKINGRTGRIEGRPFTSSVRKLARRASNSRASI